jgi:hypothetical protein
MNDASPPHNPPKTTECLLQKIYESSSIFEFEFESVTQCTHVKLRKNLEPDYYQKYSEKTLPERGTGPPHAAGVAASAPREGGEVRLRSSVKNETNPHLVQKVRSFKLGVPSGPLRSPAAAHDLVSKRYQIENLEIPQFLLGIQYGRSACLSHPLGPPRRHRATADITELQLCCVEVSTVLP